MALLPAGVLHVNARFKVPRAAYRSINVGRGGGGGFPVHFENLFLNQTERSVTGENVN